MRGQRGFSLIELLTVTALLGALSGIALINSRELRERGYDAISVSDYRNLKTVVLGEEIGNQGNSSYLMFGRTGPGRLPSPLQTAQLSKDVELTFALRISIANINIVYFQLAHAKGAYLYRYISINGNVTEQRIAR